MIYQGRAIFGCRDGCVYSLRASDGELAWRLETQGAHRLIMAYEQLESVLPIHGSVLVNNGSAYFTAGRSSYLDGGINLYRINARTGKVLSKNRIYSPEPETGKQPDQEGPAYMPGALSDILSCDADCVYLRDSVYDKNGSVLHESRSRSPDRRLNSLEVAWIPMALVHDDFVAQQKINSEGVVIKAAPRAIRVKG